MSKIKGLNGIKLPNSDQKAKEKRATIFRDYYSYMIVALSTFW